jgi:hypothetical protein
MLFAKLVKYGDDGFESTKVENQFIPLDILSSLRYNRYKRRTHVA